MTTTPENRNAVTAQTTLQPSSTQTTPSPSPLHAAAYSPAKKPATCSFPNEPKLYITLTRTPTSGSTAPALMPNNTPNLKNGSTRASKKHIILGDPQEVSE